MMLKLQILPLDGELIKILGFSFDQNVKNVKNQKWIPKIQKYVWKRHQNYKKRFEFKSMY